MRIAAPMLIAGALVLAACAEPTAPRSAPAAPNAVIVKYTPGHQPPPPVDTGATVALSGTGETLTPLRVDFNLNDAGNAGYIRFELRQPAGAFATPFSSINFSAQGTDGTLVGRGFLVLRSREGYVYIDLARNLDSINSKVVDCTELDISAPGVCTAIAITGARIVDNAGRFVRFTDASLSVRPTPPPPPPSDGGIN